MHRAGDVQEERVFGGALGDQIRGCLNHLENLSTSHLQKQPDRSQVRGWVSYPLPALRETLVNVVYHRGYDAAGVRANQDLVGTRGLWPPAVGLQPPAAQRSPNTSGAGHPARYGADPPCLGVERACATRSTGCGRRSERSRMPIARRSSTCRPMHGSFGSWRRYERLGDDPRANPAPPRSDGPLRSSATRSHVS